MLSALVTGAVLLFATPTNHPHRHPAHGRANPSTLLLARCHNRSLGLAKELQQQGHLPEPGPQPRRDVTAGFWASPRAEAWRQGEVDPLWKGPRDGAVCAGDLHGTVVRHGLWEYVRLYKCNNDRFRKMMRRWPQPKRLVRFTFVRDPIARFVSGYRELEFRYRCNRGFPSHNATFETTPLRFLQQTPGSQQRAETFLTEFFAANTTPWEQFNPQGAYGHLCPYVLGPGFSNRVFVGKLEDMKGSLAALSRWANVPSRHMRVEPRTHGHPSETDLVANLEKRAMLTFLEQSPRWVARLVARYTPDICLFGYNHTACPESPTLAALRPQVVPLYGRVLETIGKPGWFR